jgi:hypothetical protein
MLWPRKFISSKFDLSVRPSHEHVSHLEGFLVRLLDGALVRRPHISAQWLLRPLDAQGQTCRHSWAVGNLATLSDPAEDPSLTVTARARVDMKIQQFISNCGSRTPWYRVFPEKVIMFQRLKKLLRCLPKFIQVIMKRVFVSCYLCFPAYGINEKCI